MLLFKDFLKFAHASNFDMGMRGNGGHRNVTPGAVVLDVQ